MEEITNIVLICDNNYVIPTATTIQSLKENRKVSEYNVYILADRISEQNKKLLQGISELHTKVTILEANSAIFEGLHKSAANNFCVATESALLKLQLPLFFPNLDEILYLDGDLIIRKDLKGFCKIPLGDNYTVAVPDSGSIYGNRPIQKQCITYFNTGVMRLNLKKMRENNATEKMIEIKRTITDHSLMDQDVFNTFFDGKVVPADIIFNFLYINLLRAESKYTMSQLNHLFGTSYKDLSDIRKNSVIIHFSSKDKPWKYTDVKLADEWYTYFQHTPFKNFKLERKSLVMEKMNKKVTDLEKLFKDQIKNLSKEVVRLNNEVNRMRMQQLESDLKFTYKLGVANNNEEIIVSLTSYPKRISFVPYVIDSLLKQTVKPNRIILNLYQDEFDNELPTTLLKQCKKCGVEISYCNDTGSHKKYLKTMCENRDSVIITVDDDIYYRNDLIEKLYAAHLKYPNAVCAMRTHLIKFNTDGTIKKYSEWKQRYVEKILQPSHRLFATGCGGILYPPGFYEEKYFDEEKINEMCKFGDDIWLKAVELVKNIKVQLVDDNINLDYLPNSQDCALFRRNVEKNENDVQISEVFSYFEKYAGSLLPIIARDITLVGSSELDKNANLLYSIKDYDSCFEQCLLSLDSKDSIFRIAQLYRNGLGVPKDIFRAYLYMLMAIDGGHKGAVNEYVKIAPKQKGTLSQNKELLEVFSDIKGSEGLSEIISVYISVLPDNGLQSYYNLGKIYSSGAKKDIILSEWLFRKAVELGTPGAKEALDEIVKEKAESEGA